MWARSSGNTTDAAQASASTPFTVGEPPPPPQVVKLTAVTVTADKVAPQAPGTAITFRATAVGGPAHYRFMLYDGTAMLKYLTGWTTQSSLTWIPAVANAKYEITCWFAAPRAPRMYRKRTRKSGSRLRCRSSRRSSSVSLATSKPAPQLRGTTIVATATAVAGSATVQYKWLIHDGLAWKEMTGWTLSRTFSWTPTVANKGHYIGVWARNAASTTGQTEATASIPFAIK